jgi:hypothetical protein
MLEKARSYLGQKWIGTNQYDKGECVGLYNKVVLDVTGILYPLKGAQGAKDLMTCTNTRPDLFQQIWNDPKNPNQIPAVNDWVVWGATWGGGYGHVACVETVNTQGFTSIEQNATPHTVTRQNHNWNGVIGWIRYTGSQPTPTPGGATMTDDTARQVGFNYLGRNGYDGRPNALAAPQPDLQGQPLTNAKLGEIFLSQEARNWRDGALPKVYADRDAYAAQVSTLSNQVNTLNLQLTQKQAELDQANAQIKTLSNANTALMAQVSEQEATISKLEQQVANQQTQIAQLEKELANCGGKDITINFNFIGAILWFVIKKVGKK